jgi:hypothetical protein
MCLARAFFEHHLPILVAQGHDVAIVVQVDELLARAALLLAHEVRKLVIAVEMDLEGLGSGLVALEKFVLDIRVAGGRQQGRHPVERADCLIRD